MAEQYEHAEQAPSEEGIEETTQDVADGGQEDDSTYIRRLMAEANAERIMDENERLRAENERLKQQLEAQAAQTAPQQPQEPNYGDDLNDPRFPPSHPRNTPGDAAYKIAQRERERREKNAQAQAQHQQVDPNGHPVGYDPTQVAAQAQQAIRAKREAEEARRQQIAESLHDPEERRRLEQEQSARQRHQVRESMAAKNRQVWETMRQQ